MITNLSEVGRKGLQLQGVDINQQVAWSTSESLDLRLIAPPLHSEGIDDKKVYAWCQGAHDCLAAAAAADDREAIEHWKERALPKFLFSDFLRRCRSQPRGYAGDYLTIQMMYEARPVSDTQVGRAIDAWAMNQPCPKAVRNRRGLIKDFISRIRAETDDTPVSIASFGCGPAAEILDCAEEMSNLQFKLVDIDPEALAYVESMARARGVAQQIATVKANIIKMSLRDRGEVAAGLAGIYSMGLIDYFVDDVVVRLLNLSHQKLRVGGRLLLGNFRPDHPNAALFEHGLNWPLILRSKSQLLELVRRSKFVGCWTRVDAEAAGVQLFLECRKE